MVDFGVIHEQTHWLFSRLPRVPRAVTRQHMEPCFERPSGLSDTLGGRVTP